ncbi:flagellar filament capping protein FliD [Candidatus Arthromitus sp. SFB-rat-Yit]|uniref:flagellar filament capping protein FliD n=1 Tax=Candidatus Arthromitus sp. SFB-rat-Yit TaxID=1041504 RepID=UPI000227A5DA|nr:flagellar filament capping protein FliD [Candidatus Arthromitus sp. SFB-rat-Yit]BAK81044.1 flagellar hook-associated protein [Candidatus Arthromitus sp. SFB-rat-Yit]
MSSIQMTGMASGLDTKAIVESMLQTEKSKIDRINQNKQILEWRQELYREIITEVRDFSKKYFDPLNKETYIMGSGSLSGIKADSTVSKTVANIIAGGTAEPGNYELKMTQMAKPAKVTGSNVINQSTVKGDLKIPVIIGADNNTIKIDGHQIKLDSKSFDSKESLAKAINVKIQENDSTKDKYEVSVNKDGQLEVKSNFVVDDKNDSLKIDVGGKEYTIKLDKGSYSQDKLVNQIKSKLKKVISSDEYKELKVEVDESGQVKVNDKNLDSLKFETPKVSIVGQDSTKTSADNILQYESKFIKGQNSDLVISVRGKDPTVIDLSDIDTSKSKEEILNEISKKVNENTNKTNVSSSVVNGKLVFKTDLKEQIVISGSAANSIGIGNSLDITLDVKTEKMVNVLNFDNPDDKKVEFTINGETFKYDFGSKEDKDGYKGGQDLTIKQVFSDISSRAKVNISYNTISRSFNIESKETGKEVVLSGGDTSGKFIESLFGTNKLDAKGESAIVEFMDGDGNSNTFEFSSNSFTLAGITFDIKTLPTEPIKVSVIEDTDKTVELMKGFVEDFNKIMDDLNTKTRERKNSKFKPLTEAQKEAMSEKEIELWEAKAKQGILGNESELESFMYELRNAIFTPVDGVNLSMREIGLDTSNDYKQGGKIIFDEEKFRKALASDPQSISELFTKTSDSGNENYNPDLTADERKAKNADQGIFRRINDVVNDYTRTTRNKSGKKGTFIEIAGIEGDTTFLSNTISKKIKEYDEKIDKLNDLITTRENRYYAQFTRLETALSKLQSQSSMFMQ